MSDEIEVRKLNREESWNLTDEIRQGFETIHESKLAQVDRLARAYEGYAWEGMGYDSFEEYKAEEFGDDLQQQRLELEERIGAVKVLADSGMAKAQIADILGVHRNTVTNLLKRIDAQPADHAQRCASNEVDAPGQSVEEVGHIEDDEPQPQPVTVGHTPQSENQETPEPNNSDEPADTSWMDDIDFGAMILNPPPAQIIETDTSTDTPDYFVPRAVAPSWSPPVVKPLGPAPVTAYDELHDTTPEFLEPPMKLLKAGEANKTPEDKHCRTCACNLLP